MATITIDNVEYNTDNLSQDALQQLKMLQVTDAEIGRLNAQLAITQTARIAYANALKASLPVSLEQPRLYGVFSLWYPVCIVNSFVRTAFDSMYNDMHTYQNEIYL